jgi:type II secretory pathway component GspD/PulD (secretin)
MSQHLLAGALLILAAMPAAAQERPAAEQKRGTYVVKYAAAKDLAGILAKHFKGVAEIQTGPEGTSNCLLVNAPPAVFDEVMKTVEQLDRRPHSITVEVLVITLPADKEKQPEEKQFSGTIDEVAAHLDAMMKKGEVASYKGFELMTLEGQQGLVALGDNKPIALGPGRISYRDMGTRIKVTPQVTADRSIVLDLKVEDSGGRPSPTVTGLTEFITSSLAGKISVASGNAVLAKDVKVISKEGQGGTLVVVSARIADAEGKNGK